MPLFAEPVVAAYIDVDLVSSTRTCIKYLYPLLVPGGILFSQDGHLPLVVKLLKDEHFWRSEIGCPPPQMDGLGQQKLVRIVKPVTSPTT
jgi:O-methyltransferase